MIYEYVQRTTTLMLRMSGLAMGTVGGLIGFNVFSALVARSIVTLIWHVFLLLWLSRYPFFFPCEQVLPRPEAARDLRFHRRSDAQRLMDADEVVVEEMHVNRRL